MHSCAVSTSAGVNRFGEATPLQRVKEKGAESKNIIKWNINAESAKISSRFRREDSINGGWESHQDGELQMLVSVSSLRCQTEILTCLKMVVQSTQSLRLLMVFQLYLHGHSSRSN